ncbi:MAG TPA: hypothetical protein ENJ82_06925 [Bacteroidetes bacterium]|nr:hypothetical protein [Bacteroidota bacterium]
MEAPATIPHSPHLNLKTMHGFLAESLSAKAMKSAEIHVQQCTLCAAALENIACDPNQDRESQTDAFAASFRDGLDRLALVAPQQPSAWNGFFKVAAAVLLALNFGWAAWFFAGGNSNTGFSPFPADEVRSGADASALDQALLPYAQGDFAKAIRLLKALPDRATVVERKLLYLGSAYLALDQPAQAVLPLERLVQNPEWVLYRADARHFLGIAYRKIDANNNNPK